MNETHVTASSLFVASTTNQQQKTRASAFVLAARPLLIRYVGVLRVAVRSTRTGSRECGRVCEQMRMQRRQHMQALTCTHTHAHTHLHQRCHDQSTTRRSIRPARRKNITTQTVHVRGTRCEGVKPWPHEHKWWCASGRAARVMHGDHNKHTH
jgi:hypothetical protein